MMSTGQEVSIHPSSVLCGRRSPYIVFDELLRTTRNYAKNVTVIDAMWLPASAPNFFKRDVTDAG